MVYAPHHHEQGCPVILSTNKGFFNLKKLKCLNLCSPNKTKDPTKYVCINILYTQVSDLKSKQLLTDYPRGANKKITILKKISAVPLFR